MLILNVWILYVWILNVWILYVWILYVWILYVWILKNKNRILYNMCNINANFNVTAANRSEKIILIIKWRCWSYVKSVCHVESCEYKIIT